MELVSGPQNVEFVKCSMGPIVNELNEQQREEPCERIVQRQVHYGIVGVYVVENANDYHVQKNSGQGENESGSNIDDHIFEASQIFVLKYSDELFQEN